MEREGGFICTLERYKEAELSILVPNWFLLLKKSWVFFPLIVPSADDMNVQLG